MMVDVNFNFAAVWGSRPWTVSPPPIVSVIGTGSDFSRYYSWSRKTSSESFMFFFSSVWNSTRYSGRQMPFVHWTQSLNYPIQYHWVCVCVCVCVPLQCSPPPACCSPVWSACTLCTWPSPPSPANLKRVSTTMPSNKQQQTNEHASITTQQNGIRAVIGYNG